MIIKTVVSPRAKDLPMISKVPGGQVNQTEPEMGLPETKIKNDSAIYHGFINKPVETRPWLNKVTKDERFHSLRDNKSKPKRNKRRRRLKV